MKMNEPDPKKRASFTQHSAFHYLESQKPVSTNILLFLAVAAIAATAIFLAVDSGQVIAIPYISIAVVAWYSFFNFSNAGRIAKRSGVMNRCFLTIFLTSLGLAVLYLEDSEVSSLFVYPLSLIHI